MARVESSGKAVHDDEVESAARLQAMALAESCALPFAVKAAVTLGVTNILVNAGPDASLSAADICKHITTPTGAPADIENLERILRLLASHGVLEESIEKKAGGDDNARKYKALPVVKYLVEDKAENASLAPFMNLHLSPVFAPTLQFLHAPVLDKTAEPHVLVHGMASFEWAAVNPDFDKMFNRVMANHSTIYMKLFLEKYDGFKSLNSLMDVGGGIGVTVASIVAKYPHIKGINFDQPHVVNAAPQYPGVKHVGGSFFESLPEADAVFMKWILHDWNDECCLKILKNIEKALPEHGKIINFDSVLPEETDSSTTTRLNLATDLLMMAYNSGGKERSLSQFRKLGAQAGFSRVEVKVTIDNQSLIEFYKK